MERRLDRDRPLWECWIIDDLAQGRWAVLMKLHHCIADGIATMHMFSGLSDAGEERPSPPRSVPQRAIGKRIPAPRQYQSTELGDWRWHLAASATSAAALAIEGAVEITGGLLRPAATRRWSAPSPQCGATAQHG